MDTTQITMYAAYAVAAAVAVAGAKFGYLDGATTGGILLLIIGNFLGLHIPSPQQNQLLKSIVQSNQATETVTTTVSPTPK